MSELHNNKTFVFLSRACVVLLLICLVFNLFVMPSFALTFDNTVPVDGFLPVLSASNDLDTWNNSVQIDSNYAICSTSNPSLCIIYVRNSGVYVVGDINSECSAYLTYKRSNNTMGSPSSFTSFTNVNNDFQVNYVYLTSSASSSYLYQFSDLNSGLSAVRDFIDNGGGSSYQPFSLNDYQLPAGNVMYIQAASQSSYISLNTTFEQYSTLFGSSWSNITQRYQQGVSLPTSGTTFPLSGMGTIPWEKSSDTNLLGQTKIAYYQFQAGNTSDNYTVIYNPLYQQYGQGGNYDMNHAISVSCADVLDYKVYPLSGSIVTGVGMQSGSTSDYVSNFSPQRDDNGDVITGSNGQPIDVNENGDVSSPQTGGTNLLPEDMSISDYIQQLTRSLDTFANNFVNLMKSPVSHVQQLISAGSDYFNVIRGLYAWLPSPVQTTIESALVVSISIGVIGLLL